MLRPTERHTISEQHLTLVTTNTKKIRFAKAIRKWKKFLKKLCAKCVNNADFLLFVKDAQNAFT